MPDLKTLHQEEKVILAAIVALALQLPQDLAAYTPAIGELRRGYFKKSGRTYERRRGGFSESRTIRASERYGR